MAGISNIIGAYNINPKRVSSKLSFEVGQVFSAKIVSTNELSKELILKLLDGWQFSAKLENPLLDIPEGLAKFQVEGFQDGKLQIKLIKTREEKQEINKGSLEDLISEGNLEVDKEDYNMMRKMLKHDMPLTKENISKVKTLIDFREKLLKNDGEADSFIYKYVNNKNIDINSSRGKDISQALKGFFKELANLSEDELLTMLENNLDINEANIKSFIKLFRGDSTIYKELKAVQEEMNLQTGFGEVKIESNSLEEQPAEKDIKSQPKNIESHSIDNILEQELQGKNVSEEERALYKDLEQLMKSSGELDAKDDGLTKKALDVDLKDITAEVQKNTKTEETSSLPKHNFMDTKLNQEKIDKSILETQVKEQLAAKTEEIKDIIKNILGDKKGIESESYGKVLQTLKESINDFKVFNSVSNQYYYMDVPVNINREDYQCKLLIKDDRKSGKKLDSTNISMVVSVKTLKIGVVDAYIKVRDKNMSVDFKCEEDWVKILSAGKDILLNELSELGYNAFFNVDKRHVEASLVNCREFFEDNELGSINTKA